MNSTATQRIRMGAPPQAAKPTLLSKFKNLFRSRTPKLEAAWGPVQSRDLLAMRRCWENGKEASLALERKFSVYFSNVEKARKMGLLNWKNDFARLLALPESDISSDAPALMQKIRIISCCEKALLAFSVRCATKARVSLMKENPREDLSALNELMVFLEYASTFMEDEALTAVREDLCVMASAIVSMEQGRSRKPATRAKPEEAPAMAG